MKMKSFSYTVKDELGIHARPAGMLVKEVKNFQSKVTLEKDGKSVDASRLMAVMGMGVKKDQTVTVTVEGDDEDAACDAMTRYIDQDKLDKDDVNTYYEVAERYNGLGYRNKGVASPYVWAGSSNYSCGKYVADGQYDPNYVDRQLGVAVMLKRLMS